MKYFCLKIYRNTKSLIKFESFVIFFSYFFDEKNNDATSSGIGSAKKTNAGYEKNWYSHFTPEIDSRIVNKIKSPRILILWGTKMNETSTILTDESLSIDSKFKFQAESRRVQRLQRNLVSNKISFHLVDLREQILGEPMLDAKRDNECLKDKPLQTSIRAIKDFFPTTIVLPFSSTEFGKYPLLNLSIPVDKSRFKKTYNRLDIIKDIHEHFLLQEVIDRNPNYMIFQTKNVTQNEVCFLSFITSNCQPGIKASITDALDNILQIAKDIQETKLLVISGSSGDPWDKISGFTDPELLDDELYRATCEIIGVDPLNEEENSLPNPNPQMPSHFLRKDALLNSPKYENMKFLVLNIKQFLRKQMLRDFVNEYKPHAIIIDWPFSKDGDVANYLCSSGILPELRLTLERTSIVGARNNWIQLDENQRKILNDVSSLINNDNAETINLKHVLLYGGHGSGKTILGVEVAKMFMAKQRQEQNKDKQSHLPNLIVLDMEFDRTWTTQKSQLLHQLQIMFEHEDGCDKKVFWTINDFQEESGIEIDEGNYILLAVKEFIAKISKENKGKNSIILMDEMSAKNFLKDSFSNQDDEVALIDFSQLDFGKHVNVQTIICVSPVIGTRQMKRFKILELSQNEEQTLLKQSNVIVRQLGVSYRNCWQIQLFYNCFKNHYDESKDDDVYDTLITGNMNQPSSTTSKENNEKIDNLPSGHVPVMIKYKKPGKDWTKEEIQTMKSKIFEILDIEKRNENISIICGNANEDCSLCQDIKTTLQINNQLSSLTSIRGDNGFLGSTGYGGSEEDNVFIHLPSNTDDNPFAFELFSRSRKRLVLMISENALNGCYPLNRALNELTKHEEICENKLCQEKGWAKKKVIDVRDCLF